MSRYGARLSSRSSGSALARLRVKYGLTQQELADVSGVGVQTVSRLESGPTPRYPTAAKIARALDTEVRALWPLLAKAVEVEGRLLETVIPITRAVKPGTRALRLRLAYQDPDGGQYARHEHRPPICCGEMFCRCVDLSDPETYRVVGEPTRIPAGGVNG